MLPITTVRLIIYLVKITVQFPGWGGYFFVVLLPLEPIAYPRPNEVKQRLSTASSRRRWLTAVLSQHRTSDCLTIKKNVIIKLPNIVS